MRSNQHLANHPIDQEEVMAYLDGELPVERATAVAAHLGECSNCQSLAASLKYVSESLMSWEIEAASDQLTPAIAAAVDNREVKDVQRHQPKPHLPFSLFRSLRPLVWGPTLAVFVLVLIIWTAASSQRQRALGPLPPMQSFAEAERSLALTDRVSSASGAMSAPIAKQDQRDRSFYSAASHKQALLSEDTADRAALPMIARSGSINLTSSNLEKTRAALDDLLRRRQGYMGQLNVATPTEGARSLTASLRVPADQLEPTLADLRTLGHVQSESQNGEEVTAQYVDLQARLQNARNTEERLTALLRQQTGKLTDVLAVETESGRIRGEIESMEAEKKLLDTRITFATLNVTVFEEFKARIQMVPNSIGARFRNAAIDGYQSAVSSLIAFLLFLVAYGPSLLLWAAILFLPCRLLWKRWKRKRAGLHESV